MQREIKDHQETEFLVQRESEDKRDTQKTGSWSLGDVLHRHKRYKKRLRFENERDVQQLIF